MESQGQGKPILFLQLKPQCLEKKISDQTMIIDVRKNSEFKNGHIKIL